MYASVPVVHVLTQKYKLQYLVLPLLSEVATGGIIFIEICTSENDSGTDIPNIKCNSENLKRTKLKSVHRLKETTSKFNKACRSLVIKITKRIN